MYKADIKYPNHSDRKKAPFLVKQTFFSFFLQTPKMSITRHSYLVTNHAFSKIRVQFNINWMSVQRNKIGTNKLKKKKQVLKFFTRLLKISMYKTSLRKVCSLNCCYKNIACSKVFAVSAHGRNTNAQMWSFPFEICEKKNQVEREACVGILIKKKTFSEMFFFTLQYSLFLHYSIFHCWHTTHYIY